MPCHAGFGEHAGSAVGAIYYSGATRRSRYHQPPKHWIVAPLESKELLALCIKRVKVGSPLPHLRRDRAHPTHVCNRTGLVPLTSAPRLCSPRLHWPRARYSHTERCRRRFPHCLTAPAGFYPGLLAVGSVAACTARALASRRVGMP